MDITKHYIKINNEIIVRVIRLLATTAIEAATIASALSLLVYRTLSPN